MSKSVKEIIEDAQIGVEDEFLFLLRINKKELMLMESKEQALLAVDALASSFVEELESEDCNIYRINLKENSKVKISRKDIGKIFNSGVYEVLSIDFVPVRLSKKLK